MDIEQIKETFRYIDISKYPELSGYSREQIYDGKMGPGGLFLATEMARHLALKPGMKVLDLGCGKAATSIFIARHYDVNVYAVDLWIKAHENYKKIIDNNLNNKVIPMNLDITKDIPFSIQYFDAIFCMDSVHYYGGNMAFWKHLLPYLKNNGLICIGSPCFNTEFTEQLLQHLPFVYDDGTNLWPNEFSKYHSPSWWKYLLTATEEFKFVESHEIENGIVFWEDDVLYSLDHSGDYQKAKIDAAQYTYRQDGVPYLTHFILWAEKK